MSLFQVKPSRSPWLPTEEAGSVYVLAYRKGHVRWGTSTLVQPGCFDRSHQLLSHAHPVLGSDHTAVVCFAAPTSYSLSLTVLNLSFSDFLFLIPPPPQIFFFFFASISSSNSHQPQAEGMLRLAGFPNSCHAPSMLTRTTQQRELGGPLRPFPGMEPEITLPRVIFVVVVF